MSSLISKSLLALFIISMIYGNSNAQLSTTFYSSTCPNLESIVRSVMMQRANFFGASILRMFFHDCFVNGCDASLLLDDNPPIKSEKSLPQNGNLRGFEVIDAIKANVERACNATVSCADILALAARDSVFLLGGPTWNVLLGRRDSKTASAAATDLPGPREGLSSLISKFQSKGLNAQDMTALSGAHTIGLTKCANFRSHIYGDQNVDASFATLRKQTCPPAGAGGDNNLAPLDIVSSNRFDNGYFKDLVEQKALFRSDQELYNGGSQDSLVMSYSTNPSAFFNDFVTAMIKMGNISPNTGSSGEIRLNCRKPN